jgi:predicted dienelactone hydrolase
MAACADSGTKQAAPSSSSPAPTSTTAAPTRPFHVTRRDITIEDTSRPTNAVPDRNLAEKPTRTLPLMLLVPDGPGPFPLLEFSHGVTGTGPDYEGYLQPLAAAGYVVAAPTFPLSSGPDGEIGDYVNQPGDVYFVIDSVIKMSNDVSDPLHGRVDADHIAIAGHSLGAMTTYGAAYNSCCTQARIAAAIVLSGVEAPFPDGDYSARPAIPMLLAHGAKDTTIIVSSGDDLYAKATGPTAYVRYPDATHNSIFGSDKGELLDQATIAWLDKWLRNDSTGFDALPAAVTASGIATLQTKNL